MVFQAGWPSPPTLSQREREQEGSRAKQRPDETKAERSDGPCGLPFPSGRAEKRRAWGGHVLRSKPMLCALTGLQSGLQPGLQAASVFVVFAIEK